tara:strand:- start:305 stop:598 length:294 start_codon:yes stop_codon:yes gene_type:complete
MNEEQANELLDKFPELQDIIFKLRELSPRDKKKYGELIILNILSTSSETDGDFISYVERLEHAVNSELYHAPNALSMLATLSRLRYKINSFMDYKGK